MARRRAPPRRLLGTSLVSQGGRDVHRGNVQPRELPGCTGGDRAAKSPESRAKVREAILAMRPDVLAIQEIGRPSALLELRAALRADGLDYTDWEHVGGPDTNIFLGVLSRFPIVARRPQTNENFLLRGRRYQVSRGFAEVEIQVNARYRFTLLNAHLKSRRAVGYADEAELREQEAARLRALIDNRLRGQPQLNLVVLGDFNDTQDSPTLRRLLGEGRTRLVDTRPAERNGDSAPPPIRVGHRAASHGPTITGSKDTYDRIDYVLLSPGMAREWERDASYVFAFPNWGTASDHRPVVASFTATDR
ncbi:MAG: endonuclease/exonuclease/phosphatase family protein [Verrucomicrobia bacterium]|nr:endonuclease/exonuclease/phosphatase family protein [Verrucomicrobiota bacterium]